MTKSDFSGNRFVLDVVEDLERVDEVATRLLKDRDLWPGFIRDPNGVLVKLGLHPPATPEANERTNRTFYAMLANKDLIKKTLQLYDGLDIPREHLEFYSEGLKKGVIQNNIELDLLALEHFFSNEQIAREIYTMALYDINEKDILTRRYEKEELDQHIDKMLRGISLQQSITDLPTLETWDRHYGVGTGYGFGEAEVGPAVTIDVAVQVQVGITAVIPVFVAGLIAENMSELAALAIGGDKDAARAFDITSKMLDFASDLALHVQSFYPSMRR
jgi:hypothetical protein